MRATRLVARVGYTRTLSTCQSFESFEFAAFESRLLFGVRPNSPNRRIEINDSNGSNDPNDLNDPNAPNDPNVPNVPNVPNGSNDL